MERFEVYGAQERKLVVRAAPINTYSGLHTANKLLNY